MARRFFVTVTPPAVAAAILLLAPPAAAPAGAQWRDMIKTGAKVVARPKFTEEDELRIAQAQAQKFESENKMWTDPLLETYVTGLVQKLVAVAKPRSFPYRVRVVNDASLNAMTFGGGVLYIHAGLIARLENEAQLAMILGHEIAHVTESHPTKGVQSAYNTQLVGEAVATAGSAAGVLPTGPVVEMAYKNTMSAAINGYSRGQERDADRIGMDCMVKAGYDPREAPITFELLLKEYGDQPRLLNFFYGNHPSNVDRYETTSALAKEKYGSDVARRKLVVNTEDFKRATRRIVIATGRLDYEDKRFNTATAMFEKASRSWQDDPEPHYYLGKIALETGAGDAVDRAIAHLIEAIKADAKFAPAHRELGLAYYRKGEHAKAVDSLERYLAVDPEAKDADQVRATVVELKRYSR